MLVKHREFHGLFKTHLSQHQTYFFNKIYQPTVGIDFITKTMQVEGETLRLQLWDTAGQERFRSLIPSYVRDADICLIVLDLSTRSSFENLDKWLDFVRDTRGIEDALIFIVGNKADLSEREITTEELQEYAEKHECQYHEVSAKNGTNITNLFRNVSETLIHEKNSRSKEKIEGEDDKKPASKGVNPSEVKNFKISNESFIESGNNQQSRCSC